MIAIKRKPVAARVAPRHIAGDRFRAQAVPCDEIEEQRTNNTYKYPHTEDNLIEKIKRRGICGLLSEKEIQAEQECHT